MACYKRWDGYNVETWLQPCEVRSAITKRPLKTQPKKNHWPTVGHPRCLQRHDGVKVVRADGTTSERKIVYINDPYNGNVITTCKQTLRYELLVEWSGPPQVETTRPIQEPELADTEESEPESPRSPSPPPPWVPPVENPTTSTPKRRTANKTKTKSTAATASKRKNASTVAVTKKAAKVLSQGQPPLVQSVDPQVGITPSLVTEEVLQRSKALLQQKKDQENEVREKNKNSTQNSTANEQGNEEHEVSGLNATATSKIVNEEMIWHELSDLRATVEQLMQEMAALSEDVAQIKEAQNRDSLQETSGIFSESMGVLNDVPDYLESSFLPSAPTSTPPLVVGTTTSLSEQSSECLPQTFSLTAASTSTPPPVITLNQQSGATGFLSETFLQSLSSYADQPNTIARKLARQIFSREEMLRCNCNGSHGRDALPAQKLDLLRKYLFELTQTPPSRQAVVWRAATTSLDACFRSKRSYLKKTQVGI
ncbi:uncharacterized protein [Apostichopus japonicus]|uniref:uncharacterized protein isoform X2 n=1 Tax=Stichopus japonicus TaxID=307972 RepID=UPI003AB4620E